MIVAFRSAHSRLSLRESSVSFFCFSRYFRRSERRLSALANSCHLKDSRVLAAAEGGLEMARGDGRCHAIGTKQRELLSAGVVVGRSRDGAERGRIDEGNNAGKSTREEGSVVAVGELPDVSA